MRSFKIILTFILFLLIQTIPLFSHGAEYRILSDKVIKIEVKYDTGDFFSDAEVLVFPPDKTEPEFNLHTDEKGSFYFQPDREGSWILQVRGDSGHGMRINLTVDDSMLSRGSSGGSPGFLQKIIMALCVIWGTVGTVLFFRNRY